MSRLKGDIAENKACEYLNSQAFKIIEKNFYAKKLGEIDIIAVKDEIYHFIEVKSSNSYENAINNITKTKLAKLKRSVDYYIQKKELNSSFCIDAIIVVDEDIEFLENITF
ncbi:YraN family protein [Campylobacterota bacterium DY0563]|uniref:YraN family protein n=1 Tax=Halarcobacter sp. TaxID=2321133 RepID=UPI0029F59913|nr:YraN family protein [Halarcobacter sp.]